MNTLRKRVDNGRHIPKLSAGTFPECHRKNLDGVGKHAAEFRLGKMNSPTQLRSKRGVNFQKVNL
jgi:hypothetical protein